MKTIRSGFSYNYLFIAALIVLVVITYSNALNAAFISDDVKGIVENPTIGNLGAVFSEPLEFFRKLLLYISYTTGKMNPASFRIFSILFHIGTVTVVYLLLSKLFKEKYAFITAAIFAVHPVAVESVTWISAATYPQYSFFLLLSLLLYLHGKRNIRYYYLSVVAFLLSMFSSEKAVIFPFILILVEISSLSLRKGWRKSVPYFLVAGGIGVFKIMGLGSRVTALESLNTHQMIYRNPLLQIPVSITSYLQLIFWPSNLTLYHTGELTMNYVEFGIRSLITMGYLIGIVVAYRKNRFIFFWMCFFLIAITPTLLPLDITWAVAERYVYLGMIGVIAAVVYPIYRYAELQKKCLWIYIPCAIIVAALMVRSIVRNSDWRDENTFWIVTSNASPSSFNARMNAGNVYMKTGEYESATHEYEAAISLLPDRGDAYHLLGNAYIARGDKVNAAKYYLKAIAHNPSIWQSHQNLAAIYHNIGQYDRAKAEIEKALTLHPGDPAIITLKAQIDASLRAK